MGKHAGGGGRNTQVAGTNMATGIEEMARFREAVLEERRTRARAEIEELARQQQARLVWECVQAGRALEWLRLGS